MLLPNISPGMEKNIQVKIICNDLIILLKSFKSLNYYILIIIIQQLYTAIN